MPKITAEIIRKQEKLVEDNHRRLQEAPDDQERKLTLKSSEDELADMRKRLREQEGA